MTAERYDAFVSYGHGDAEWAQALAENLERLALHVFLDKWELVAGDLIAVRLQQGLAAADAVVFVVSAESVGRGWVDEEFAAAIAAAVARRQRLIPVLAGEVALPPFVASRLYLDFRNVDSPVAYEAKVRELAAAIRSRPSGVRPGPGGGIVPPPGDYRAEGPRSTRLTIGDDVVTFTTADQEVKHRPGGLDARARAVLGELAVSRARPGAGPLRAAAGAGSVGMHATLVQVGTALGRCFLDGAAGQALAAEVAAAAGGGAAVRLAVDSPDAGLADFPWETLVLPGQVTPLVLQERVELYRAAPVEHRPPAIQVRGPLRILAVIASPDTGGSGASYAHSWTRTASPPSCRPPGRPSETRELRAAAGARSGTTPMSASWWRVRTIYHDTWQTVSAQVPARPPVRHGRRVREPEVWRLSDRASYVSGATHLIDSAFNA